MIICLIMIKTDFIIEQKPAQTQDLSKVMGIQADVLQLNHVNLS